ncbi:MAG: efflux RND transporter permease subunit [Candidatus Eremiobacteraeota bacterium]|nr:efflux RND transporter permease subunit [Candidatus Eremiobacteraeota bacterium]
MRVALEFEHGSTSRFGIGMDVGRFAQRHDKVLLFAVAALAGLGVYAYVNTPQSIFPTMSFSRIDVVADAGQLPPDQTRVAVTQPLERVFQTLPNVIEVRSTSSQGSSEIVIGFDPKTDPRIDLEYTDQALGQMRSTLPAGVSVSAVIVNPNSEPVLSYALTSTTLSQAVLREFAQRSLLPAFAGVPGLARMSIAGGPQREFHVMLDAAALAAHNVSAAQVQTALSNANDVRAVGLANHFFQRYVLVVDASLHDARSIGDVLVPLPQGAGVPIRALGQVSLGVAPAVNATSYDARPAVILNVYGLAGADAVRLATAFAARMDDVKRRLPLGTAIDLFWNQTTLIVESQRALRDAILLGALLAVLVILAFLRNLRITLVAAAIIPLAMAITILVLNRAGQTLNLMSVGGLAVAVGLIIDDAIVVIENIARNLRERPHESMPAVVRASMAQIAAPMAASTATTVVVFLPLALLSGVPGFFFRALAFTLASSLIVSLFLALFVAPTLATRFLGDAGQAKEDHGFLTRLLESYDPLLRWALSNRRAVYAISAGVLVLTVAIMARLPSDFLPKMDEGKFELAYTLPVGTTLAASDAAATKMEKILLRNHAVAAEGRFTGIDTNGFSPLPQNRGLVRVTLLPRGRRPSYDAISDDLRDRLAAAVPAARLELHQILEDMVNDLSGTPAPIEITIAGDDQRKLVALADQIATKLKDVNGTVDQFNGVTYDDPVLRIAPDGTRMAALGLSPDDIASSVAAGSQGTIATQVPGTANLIPVRVALAGRTDAFNSLADAPVVAGAGSASLGDVARLRQEPLSSDINELNALRVVRVTANISGASLSAVVGGVKTMLRGVALPPGYSVTIGGQYKAQQSSFREFSAVIVIAVVLVFAVMLATFGSFRLPLVVLTAIPLASIGVALALLLTHTPLNVSSFMGLLLLVGIVVKNGILLIDVANKRRHSGDDVASALVAAGHTRLRPIVMTTLAAIGGLLPLAAGIGSGAEMERPLAIAVIGGLSTATAFTLVLIPVLYAGFVGGDELRRVEEAA